MCLLKAGIWRRETAEITLCSIRLRFDILERSVVEPSLLFVGVTVPKTLKYHNNSIHQNKNFLLFMKIDQKKRKIFLQKFWKIRNFRCLNCDNSRIFRSISYPKLVSESFAFISFRLRPFWRQIQHFKRAFWLVENFSIFFSFFCSKNIKTDWLSSILFIVNKNSCFSFHHWHFLLLFFRNSRKNLEKAR